MGTALALLGVVLVLFVAAVLSTREGPVLADAPQDVADLDLPEGPLEPEDVTALRFGLAPRGYRMSEVDAVLDRLAAELADRDRRIALLEAAVEGATPTDVREAGEPDLPVEAAVPASEQVPAAVPAAPFWQPPAPQAAEAAEAPEPPPAEPTVHPAAAAEPEADLAAEAVQQQPHPAPHGRPYQHGDHVHPGDDPSGTAAATTDVDADVLTAALEEAGAHPRPEADPRD